MLTVRLAPLVKDRAETYAASLGLSLNALIVVALTEYLDARAVPAAVSVPAAPAVPVAPAARPVVGLAPTRSASRKKRR